MLLMSVLSFVGFVVMAHILRIVSINPNDPTLQNGSDIAVMRITNEMASAVLKGAAKSSA